MKIKLAALICIMMTLLAVLAGCGAEPAETTAAAIETTAALTELPTFLEEQGIEAGEGFTVAESTEVREAHAFRTIPNGAKMIFYKGEETAEEVIHKNIESTVDIHITKYYSDEFELDRVSDVVDRFYRAAVEDDESVTKEAWMAEHEDYVLYNCWVLNSAEPAKCINTFMAENEDASTYSNRLWMQGCSLLDSNTASVISSDDKNYAEKLSITVGDETNELYMVQMLYVAWKNSEMSGYNDICGLSEMYVMAPESYDGLIFMYAAYADGGVTDEEILEALNDEESEEETIGWEKKPYKDYIEENTDHIYFYFPVSELGERDARSVPNTTFFDRLGINLNDDIFEVTSTELRSGVIETHWSKSTAMRGAEVLYFDSEKKTAQSYVDKKLANCLLDVYAREYTSAHFDSADIADVVNIFYQADSNGLTQEEWLQNYQDYKIIHFSSEERFLVSHATESFFTNHNGYHWWTVCRRWPRIVDGYTGKVFMPQDGSNNVVEKFAVENIDFWVVNMRDSKWYNSASSDYQNFIQYNDMYVLLPAEYNGLTFTVELYEENRSDEEILALYDNSQNTQPTSTTEEDTSAKEDTSTWWSGDFYEEESYLKRYYFTTAK